MTELIVEAFKSVDPRLAVLTMSMMPIVELRGSIPVGILVYNLPIREVFILALIGNMIPNFILLRWLEPIRDFFTSRIKWMDKLYKYTVDKTHRRHSEKFIAIGAIFLVTFVAIPLPGSGSWTGCLIAYLYEVPYWKALGLIFLGIIGGAIVVTTLTAGTGTALNALMGLF